MRLNVFTFNQVNLQRACGYQAVVVSGGSGAVRLSLHSLLQWRAVTACSFCLGILQRFCLFFYDIRGGFFSPLSSVLLILPLRDVSEAFTFGAGVSSQSFFGPFACFGFVLWSVAHRRGLRARLSLVYGLFTFHYWLFCWPFSNSFLSHLHC